MSSQISINYPDVYSRTAQLQSRIVSEIQTLEQEYSQIMSSIKTLDGMANTMFELAVERNRRKALALAEILDKLLSFISNSASHIEIHEQRQAAAYSGISQYVTVRMETTTRQNRTRLVPRSLLFYQTLQDRIRRT